MLHTALVGDRRVLHAHLEEGELPAGAWRADAQRRQHGAAVQDAGDHHDHVRGGAVRVVLVTAVRDVLSDKILLAVARHRELRGRGVAVRPVAGRS